MELQDKPFDLTAIGDLMIDFTCLGESDGGMLAYERNPGGGPMNVASQMVRLGGTAAVVACVGQDDHGDFLRATMDRLGVDTKNVGTCPHLGTRCLFVYFKDGNDRWFSEYKGPRADLEISPEWVDFEQFKQTKVLLTSPLCSIHDRPIHETARRAREVALSSGALLAFDPNFRFPYEDPKQRQLDEEAIFSAHIVKMTAEEFRYFLNEDDIMRGSERLLAGSAKIVAVSMGRDGSFLRTKYAHAYRPAYTVQAVDTTGAGDSFMGSLLYALTRPGVDIDRLGQADLADMAEFANACAGASVTRRGSLLVMPDRDEAEQVMKSTPVADAAM